MDTPTGVRLPVGEAMGAVGETLEERVMVVASEALVVGVGGDEREGVVEGVAVPLGLTVRVPFGEAEEVEVGVERWGRVVGVAPPGGGVKLGSLGLGEEEMVSVGVNDPLAVDVGVPRDVALARGVNMADREAVEVKESAGVGV